MSKELNPTLIGVLVVVAALLLVAVLPLSIEIKPQATAAQDAASTLVVTQLPVSQPAQASGQSVEYTLKAITGQQPPMGFFGVGGSIDGQANPTLTANTGDTVTLHVINGDPVIHDLTLDVLNLSTGELVGTDASGTLTFEVTQPGEYVYRCTIPGHDAVGMKGILKVSGEPLAAANTETMPQMVAAVAPTVAPAEADAVSIVRSPADVPAPVGDRLPQTVRVDLTTQEVTGVLADGTTYSYFTFDGQIPGPMIRVRVGDTVELHLKNADNSLFPHSIDLHAVTGPGGGAVYTQTNPGGETFFTFQAINVGLYVYHCATPSVAHHIASGMYGLILVEPKGGLPSVDKEFYVMQSEFYTKGKNGQTGLQPFDMNKALDEKPEYVVFNGSVGSMTGDKALKTKVGDKVRLYVGNGGPNLVSSFHVIGEIFDSVYTEGGTEKNQKNVQTTLVPAGGSAIVDFKMDVPGNYVIVDHSIFRTFNKGALGILKAEGEANTTIYSGKQADTVYLGEGGATQTMPAVKDAKVAAKNKEERITEGKRVYANNCQACHMNEGQGVPKAFPPLAKSDYLNADKQRAIRIVLEGKSGAITVNKEKYDSVMPALGLSDEDVANVLTFVLNSWGNSGGVVTPTEVSGLRSAH